MRNWKNLLKPGNLVKALTLAVPITLATMVGCGGRGQDNGFNDPQQYSFSNFAEIDSVKVGVPYELETESGYGIKIPQKGSSFGALEKDAGLFALYIPELEGKIDAERQESDESYRSEIEDIIWNNKSVQAYVNAQREKGIELSRDNFSYDVRTFVIDPNSSAYNSGNPEEKLTKIVGDVYERARNEGVQNNINVYSKQGSRTYDWKKRNDVEGYGPALNRVLPNGKLEYSAILTKHSEN